MLPTKIIQQTQTKKLRLKLRGINKTRKRVTWRSDVVDNEHMNKKKSKKCCVYHRPKLWNESESESD